MDDEEPLLKINKDFLSRNKYNRSRSSLIPKGYITEPEASEMLSVAKGTIARWRTRGVIKIPFEKKMIDGTKRILYKIADVEAFSKTRKGQMLKRTKSLVKSLAEEKITSQGYVTAKDASEMVGRSLGMLKRWRDKEINIPFKVFPMGKNNRIFYLKTDVEAYIKNRNSQ